MQKIWMPKYKNELAKELIYIAPKIHNALSIYIVTYK